MRKSVALGVSLLAATPLLLAVPGLALLHAVQGGDALPGGSYGNGTKEASYIEFSRTAGPTEAGITPAAAVRGVPNRLRVAAAFTCKGHGFTATAYALQSVAGGATFAPAAQWTDSGAPIYARSAGSATRPVIVLDIHQKRSPDMFIAIDLAKPGEASRCARLAAATPAERAHGMMAVLATPSAALRKQSHLAKHPFDDAVRPTS